MSIQSQPVQWKIMSCVNVWTSVFIKQHSPSLENKVNLSRRVARIWKRGGGAILKEWEVCTRPWLKFSLNLNQFQTVCPKIETKFLGKLGNSKVFSAQNQVFTEIESDFSASKVFSAQNQVFSKKKKKGLLWNWEWFFGRNPKFKGFFRPKSGVLQKKKKKRSSPKLRLIFRPISQIQTFEGSCFCMGGGLFSIFHKQSASKAQKTCDFAYFTSQWGGGLEPPRPPGYATKFKQKMKI